MISKTMKRYLYSVFYCSPKPLFVAIIFTVYGYFNAFAGDIKYSDSWGKAGYTVESQNLSKVLLNYSIIEFSLTDLVINGMLMQNIELSGHLMPNNEGAPNLPFSWRYVAVPKGSEVTYNILSYRSETLSNINVAPVLEIPLSDTTFDLQEIILNQSIYSSNRFYPEEPVVLSEKDLIGGLDVVKLEITPFHFNPVTQQLIIYRDLKIEITFSEGNGFFDNDNTNGPDLDPSLSGQLLNYESVLQVSPVYMDSMDQVKKTNSKKKVKK
jgi:hypothetical protein